MNAPYEGWTGPELFAHFSAGVDRLEKREANAEADPGHYWFCMACHKKVDAIVPEWQYQSGAQRQFTGNQRFCPDCGGPASQRKNPMYEKTPAPLTPMDLTYRPAPRAIRFKT